MSEKSQSSKNPYFIRERLSEQEKALVEGVEKITTAIAGIDPDPNYSVEPQAVVVGGFVRDALSGGEPKDLDLEVFGVPMEKLIKILIKIFGSEKVNEVGKSFGVIKIFVGGGLELDISVPRIDSKTELGDGHRDIRTKGEPSLSITEAQRRRDFTINALSMDVLSGAVIDSFGGVEDLRSKILRLVDEKTFKDDPLRVLRGVQFAARFGLTIEPKTFIFMKEMVNAGALDNLPADRIRGEIEKLFLKSKKPSVGLEIMRELGIIERYFPELHALAACEQDPERHPEGDVWIHTKLSVDQAALLFEQRFSRPENMSDTAYKEMKFIVMLAALLHDIGKPATTKIEDDGKVHSYGHETVGVELSKRILEYLNASNFVRENVLKIIGLHCLPNEQFRAFDRGEMDEDGYAKATKRLLDRLGDFPWPAFLTVCEADIRGRGREIGDYRILAAIKKIFQEKKLEAGVLVGGRNVLEVWKKIKGEEKTGGPWVGEILKRIKEEGCSTREAAVARLEEIIREK